MADSAVFKSLRKLGELVRTRQVDRRDLAEESLTRLETIGPRYNAVVTVTSDRAMRLAR